MLVALCGLALASASTQWFELEDYTFEDYVKEFEKSYSPQEYHRRKSIFEIELNSVRAHNRDSTKSWKRGINHLSDQTLEVFFQLFI